MRLLAGFLMSNGIGQPTPGSAQCSPHWRRKEPREGPRKGEGSEETKRGGNRKKEKREAKKKGDRTKRMQCDNDVDRVCQWLSWVCWCVPANEWRFSAAHPLDTARSLTSRRKCGTTWANHTRTTHSPHVLSHTFSHTHIAQPIAAISQCPQQRQSVEFPSQHRLWDLPSATVL